MRQISQCFNFFGYINRSQFSGLGNGDNFGLRMMLEFEAVQVALNCLNRDFSVRSGDGNQLTPRKLFRRATFVYIDMCSFSANNRMIRFS